VFNRCVIFTQYYLDCLSQASYLIGDETTGRAVVVDPRRDVEEYITDARNQGLAIELVIETHFHADFVSGHLELARATGAEIAYGESAETEFPSRKLADGERIRLGEVELEIRATPGHTPESISVVVWERATDETPYGVLTGDTLFIGDVGRPDLLSSVGVTADELATSLYRSIQEKLLTLPDGTRVFPGHGAGSACGKSLSTATQSTIGEQRSENYALQLSGADAFVAAVTEGQRTPPAYFGFDARRNREVHTLLHEEAPPPMTVDAVVRHQEAGAVVVDTRDAVAFAAGHLRGSVNVGLEGRFAEYAGAVLTPDDELVLVAEPGGEAEARVRLARIGYDRVAGFLAEPEAAFVARPDLVARGSRVTAAELHRRRAEVPDLVLLDVRNPDEVEASGPLNGAVLIPVVDLPERLAELDPTRPTVVYCAGGYRSALAASLLRRAGFTDVSDVLGGWAALADAA